MKPIEQVRAALEAEKAKGDDSDFMKEMGQVLDAGVKLKAAMVKRGLTRAKAVCPKCKNETLRGRLVTDHAAGRHRKSGGAFRMWCDGCPSMRMME